MAEKDPSRTEDATPKRRKKAREEGNVPKSQEVTKTVTIAVGLLALYLYFGMMYKRMSILFSHFLGHQHNFIITTNSVYSLFIQVSIELAILVMPVILSIGVAAYIALRLQVGALWTTKPFGFKWERFNIINGLKNMFMSGDSFVRLGKSLLLMLIIGFVPYRIIMNEFDSFLPLYNATPGAIIQYILNLSVKMVFYTLIPMIIIAAVDLWHTRYKYEENLKMTKHEVKDERKQAEGDPAIKNKQRQKMFSVMAKRMLKQVPTADVVITNPTHIAVALKYDAEQFPAPVVVAMGADHMAEKIKEIAREHNVPIRENVPLARALYNSVEVGDVIPEELYKAVAAILAQIWRIKGKIKSPQ
jgi:flagellar biosynthetic protein FlhB